MRKVTDENSCSLLRSLREYLLCCSLLIPGAFGLHRLDSLFPAGALFSGEEKELARYLDEDRLYRFDFLICARESHTACTADALQTSGRLDALARWLRQQNRTGFLPFLTHGRQPLSLLPAGQPFTSDSDEDRINWQLRCSLIYSQSALNGPL
ncbi:MAG: hypothetical protein HFG27_09985 [Provencibacterium sp.]|nr:hypothetical protein [Provencibacterium sp.]